MNPKDIDWNALKFDYIKTDYRYRAVWEDGAWGQGELATDEHVTIHEGSTALHYGQTCFEGLKAFSTKDGDIVIFRPDRNARRMNDSARRLLMAEVPEKMFLDACKEVVAANRAWVPPYGTGCSLYMRPYLVGIGDNMGVKPAPKYLFSIFVSPVGNYFKGGMVPVDLGVSDLDRAAPFGTGAVKVGGNYAASMLPHDEAVKAGHADCIYLDPATHTKIEEVGAANFFGITKDGVFVTPKSPSILPSITKYSLMHIAEHNLGMKVEERDVFIDNLDEFAEAGACGTAAVISPIGAITHKGSTHRFGEAGVVGPVTTKLYDLLVGMQRGEVEAPEGWIVKVG